MTAGFDRAGFRTFAPEEPVTRWVQSVLPAALACVHDPDLRARWLRAGGTWFVGVNALPNDSAGRVPGGPALSGAAMAFIRDRSELGALPLDKAQVSVVWPGYPRREAADTDASFRFRQTRDAAHVDGLQKQGGKRVVSEPQAWILGVALTDADAGAAPLVVWPGSHHIIRRHLLTALADQPPSGWGNVDLTAPYQAARREVFASCPRLELPQKPGAAVVMHRLLLHGVSPWQDGARAPEQGRMIAYFRPERGEPVQDWLTRP